jgi:hypothetical protein
MVDKLPAGLPLTIPPSLRYGAKSEFSVEL